MVSKNAYDCAENGYKTVSKGKNEFTHSKSHNFKYKDQYRSISVNPSKALSIDLKGKMELSKSDVKASPGEFSPSKPFSVVNNKVRTPKKYSCGRISDKNLIFSNKIVY